MFGLGLGPALIIGVIVCAGFLHVSPAVTMPIAAALMCLGTYAVSRERRVLDVGLYAAGALTFKVFALALHQPLETFSLLTFLLPVMRFCSSDGFVIGVGATSMLLCAVVGMSGPLLHLPKLESKHQTNGH